MRAPRSLAGNWRSRLSWRLLLVAGMAPSAAAHASSFPVDPSLPLVTGAFVQLNHSLASRDMNWWQAELASMKAIGLDTVIVQYVGYNSSYFYPTSIAGAEPHGTDSIGAILSAADQHGLEVYLGVHLDASQFAGSFDLQANRSQGTATLEELYSRYSSHGSLVGWYMPQEFSDFTVFFQPQLRDDLVTYTRELTELAGSISGLPMMISPYFGQNPNAAAYANWWDTTGLPMTGVDIFNLQDGVGTHRTNIVQSRAVFEAMAPVMAKHDVAFWANNESFNQVHGWPVDDEPFAAVPTDIDTFRQQMESTSPLVEKSVTFEFTTYMSTQGSTAAGALYRDYEEYFNGVLQPTGPMRQIDIVGYVYENPSSTFVHDAAQDPDHARLTDGEPGSLAGGPGSAFANGTWVGFGNDSAQGGPQPRVVFDLGGEQVVESVELSYLVSATPYIFAPQAVEGVASALTVAVSSDGVNFSPLAFSNDFTPWTTDLATNAFERRTASLHLGGVAASYISIDVRTPNTWMFLGEFSAFAAPLPGDYNGDGQVTIADVAVWKQSFGSLDVAADGNRNGIVDAADYVVWRDNLGAGAAVAADNVASLAEPSSLVLLAIGAVASLRRAAWRSADCSTRMGVLEKVVA